MGAAAAGAGPLLLGVDAGTSRIRAIAFDPAGRAVAEGSAPTPTRRPAPGLGEHDPEELWRAAATAVRGALAGVDDPRRVHSVAVASVGEAGVLVDRGGRPLGPALAWYDNRTAGDLARLERAFGRQALHRTTGLVPDPTFTLPKLLWLRANLPEAFAAADAWLTVGGWITYRLCGARAIDHSLASRTLALDLAAGRWSDEVLAAAGLGAELLGDIAPSGARLGAVLPEAAAATGLPAGCVVGAGGHDHACALLAAGADATGVLLDSLGTAEALMLVTPAPSRSAALLEAGISQGVVRVGGRSLPYLFGGLPTSAACVEWFRSLWPGTDHAALVAEAEAVPHGAHEALFLPQLRLGSPPFPDPAARGAFLGVSDSCTRGVLFRALLEGLALDAASQLALMRAHAGEAGVGRIVAVGGGTRNGLLLRLKASLYGMPVEAAEMPEGACLGAALLGGLAAGLFPDLASARSGLDAGWRRVEPDPAWAAPERARRLAAYAVAYAAVREVNRRLLPGAR